MARRAKPVHARTDLSYEDVLQIVELVKSTAQFSEFRLKVGEIDVHLRRRAGADDGRSRAAPQEGNGAPPVSAAGAASVDSTLFDTAAVPAQADIPAGAIIVRSPMVGTFYRAPQPGRPPFVEIGQRVEAATTVCIIEVMKLMNSIPAGATGIVRDVLVGDGKAVEYGQPLLVIVPGP